jgi:hypothetical protein
VRIEIRPLLVQGMLGTEETPYGRMPVILIAEGQSIEEQTVTFWHEMLHLALGLPGPHDETWVETNAKALAAACPDILAQIQVQSGRRRGGV